MNGWKMAANIGIVKLSLGRRAEQVAIDLGWHIAITVDGTVNELDFEGMESFAVTDCCQRVGMDRLTRNSGSDLALFFCPYRVKR